MRELLWFAVVSKLGRKMELEVPIIDDDPRCHPPHSSFKGGRPLAKLRTMVSVILRDAETIPIAIGTA